MAIKNLLFPALFLAVLSGITLGNSPVKFEGRTDIGKVKIPGSVQFDSKSDQIKITASGENIWANSDAFYFVWNKAEGDLSLSTDISWIGAGKNPHRKAGWMIRQGLEPDDPYVDAVIHGDGLISMQYREVKGGPTQEIQSPLKAQAHLIFERTGDQFTLTVSNGDGSLHPVGTITVELKGTVYAGLAVCSHEDSVSETADFSNITYQDNGTIDISKRIVESTLETINTETGLRTIVYRAKEHFEAPNWSRDGSYFIFNSHGRIYNLPVNSSTSPKEVNTGFAVNCNNDHGISPDGKGLVVSHHGSDGKSIIYLLPVEGGEPRQITSQGPSYWHGWSPDGNTLAYCAERNGEFDVYSIPVSGGDEKRLTTAAGLDDGPEYSPDGKYIYFNSVRTGQMKIWRMNFDGSEQTQITPDDQFGDWFAHISYDNKWMIFVSYDKSVEGHPANKNVVLRLMPVGGKEVKTVAKLFGGQGTINVPSWAPDNKTAAFVSYRLVQP